MGTAEAQPKFLIGIKSSRRWIRRSPHPMGKSSWGLNKGVDAAAAVARSEVPIRVSYMEILRKSIISVHKSEKLPIHESL